MCSASSRATLARSWALHPRTSSRVGIEASGSLKLTSWQEREEPARIHRPDMRSWRTASVSVWHSEKSYGPNAVAAEGDVGTPTRACQLLLTALPRLDVWTSEDLTRSRCTPLRSSRLTS